ncbi:signal peptidase I [Candidatus Wolfebacteria bacterium]|nr:signal peptidase I [Candidatus Wolfebacteria bacterium]
MKSFFYSLWETIEIGIIAIIAVFIIRSFLIQPFLVNGASMEPNFSSGDYLIIDEISYRFREPERGEVVVFRYPGNESTYFIKRVIGLPGEKVVFKNGKIFIFNKENPDGFFVKENYLSPEALTSGQETILKDNEYFVLGDNRGASFDSRMWGSLPKKEIVGLVRLRLWPFSQVLAVGKPVY